MDAHQFMGMTSRMQSVRDTRIDVIRAIALITIFINHVPGNPLEPLTTKNFGFSDAAEAFVLISGISAAFAYGLKFNRDSGLALTLKMWRRASVLYIAQMGTTLATLGIFSYFALQFAAPDLMDKINIGPLVDDTAAAIFGLVTLGHQLGYNNILSMYAVVLLMLPVFLLIGRIRLSLMVAASGALWLFAGIYKVGPLNYPNGGVWFLNPLSWQFLFIIGIAAMTHIKRGGSLPKSPYLVGAAAAYMLLSFAWVKVPLWGIDTSMGLPSVLTGFDKTFLSLPRLLHVLAGAYLVVSLPWVNGLARLSEHNPLSLMGRHALPVFVVGTILSMAAQAWRMVYVTNYSVDIAIVAAGIVLQFGVAWYIEWYRRVVNGWKPAATSGIPARDGDTASRPARIDRSAPTAGRAR
jgi:hypothetical protein